MVRPTTIAAPSAKAGGSTAPANELRLYELPADQVLRTLPAHSISLLISDPPYSTVDRHGGSGHLRRWFADSMDWPQIGRTLALGRARLRADGLAMVMTNSTGLDAAMAAMRGAGFADVRPMVWDRRYPGLGSGLRHQVEYILVCRMSGSRSMTGTDLVSVAAVGPGTADRYPTQKPDGLGRVLARMAGIGRADLVVDPFCGSGALLVGAAERGAKVIGSDISERAIALASKRLAAAAAEGAPKAPAPTRKAPKPSLEGRRTAGKPAYRNSARAAKPKARRVAR
jgi:site-specific DNA-methyltransferase (adenine-specific)